MKSSFKFFLLILSNVLFLWACPSPESRLPQPIYQTIEMDLGIQTLPKNFTLSIGDTAWIKTSVTESDFQTAINGKSDISKITSVSLTFNLKNLSQNTVLMQNNYFVLTTKKGDLMQKREKDGETYFQFRFEKNDKNYELEIGFLMKKEGVYAFNLGTYSSTQVINNYTDGFPSGGYLGLNEPNLFVKLKPNFIDKLLNNPFFDKLIINSQNDPNQLYFKVQK